MTERGRLAESPHPRQLHHGCTPCIQQSLEFWREECRFGEYTSGVHLVVGVYFHVREVVNDRYCVREEGFAVEGFGAEDGGGLDEGWEGEDREDSGGEERGNERGEEHS